jgi:hypothetical protein
MSDPLRLDFQGPLSWVAERAENCIFRAEVAQQPGVYLWTADTPDGELIYYVGQTGESFSIRMKQHYREQMSGMYMVFDPETFARGEKDLAWGGMWRSGQELRIPAFLDMLPNLLPDLVGFIRQMRFFAAPLVCDTRLRNRIEGAIAAHLYAQPGKIGLFQDRGIRYSPRTPEEKPIEIAIHCERVLRGLPNSLMV